MIVDYVTNIFGDVYGLMFVLKMFCKCFASIKWYTRSSINFWSPGNQMQSTFPFILHHVAQTVSGLSKVKWNYCKNRFGAGAHPEKSANPIELNWLSCKWDLSQTRDIEDVCCLNGILIIYNDWSCCPVRNYRNHATSPQKISGGDVTEIAAAQLYDRKAHFSQRQTLLCWCLGPAPTMHFSSLPAS